MCSSGTEKCIYWIMMKRIQFIPQFNTRQEYIYFIWRKREKGWTSMNNYCWHCWYWHHKINFSFTQQPLFIYFLLFLFFCVWTSHTKLKASLLVAILLYWSGLVIHEQLTRNIATQYIYIYIYFVYQKQYRSSHFQVEFWCESMRII